jgi:hypothetical protein
MKALVDSQDAAANRGIVTTVCIDCLQAVEKGEHGFRFCAPSGLACLCRQCAGRYRSVEELFARLCDEVLSGAVDAQSRKTSSGPVQLLPSAPPSQTERARAMGRATRS